jgi:hypothetical protein
VIDMLNKAYENEDSKWISSSGVSKEYASSQKQESAKETESAYGDEDEVNLKSNDESPKDKTQKKKLNNNLILNFKNMKA